MNTPPERIQTSDPSLKQLLADQTRMLKRMENMDTRIDNQIQKIKNKINQL